MNRINSVSPSFGAYFNRKNQTALKNLIRKTDLSDPKEREKLEESVKHFHNDLPDHELEITDFSYMDTFVKKGDRPKGRYTIFNRETKNSVDIWAIDMPQLISKMFAISPELFDKKDQSYKYMTNFQLDCFRQLISKKDITK